MSGGWDKKSHIIAHIDMDAFYASVEVLDFPELAGKPVVVGGDLKRGVVSAASYEARRYGIRSAMPLFQARRLCGDLVVQPVRMRRYSEVSRKVMGILSSFSPLVEQVSVDEAYIDLTGTERISGSPREAALNIKASIRKDTSLTCSVGVSTCKLAAKIASDLDKPDGLTVVPPSEVEDFLASRPIGDIPGVGSKSEEALRDIGIRFLGDVKRFSPEFLREKFGKAGGRLASIAGGDNISPVVPWSEPKSISNERTLPEDTKDPEIVRKYLLMLSNMVGARLRRHGYAGRTITLKLKGSDFRQVTRNVTLDKATSLGRIIFMESCKLMADSLPSGGIRLVGVGVSNLEPEGAGEQIGLFGSGDNGKWKKAERAVDDIVRRFGEGKVGPGSLIE